MNQTFPLTRSKSYDYSNKIQVHSPTPIRVCNTNLLDQIYGFSSCQRRLDFIEFGDNDDRFYIRKFHSLGALDMKHELKASEIGEGELLDSTLDSSNDYGRIGSGNSAELFTDIPERASNPLIHDVRFQQAEEADQKTIEILQNQQQLNASKELKMY